MEEEKLDLASKQYLNAQAWIEEHKVTITKEESVPLEKGLSSKKFLDWINSLDSSLQGHIKKVHFQSIDMFGPNVGFLKFQAFSECPRAKGKFIPGITFCRGGAVAILLILTCKSTGEKFSILTLQPRIPIGKFCMPEIPAGMLDDNNDFKGVAAKELEEECGIQIKKDKLINLTQVYERIGFKGMYPSAGGCDEFLVLYAYEQEMEEHLIKQLEGKLTGNLEEGETITLKIVKYQHLWREAPDAKTLSALFLYEKFKQQIVENAKLTDLLTILPQ